MRNNGLILLIFIYILTFTLPVAFADDEGGCESWELSRAGGYERGIDLSGRDFISTAISTVSGDKITTGQKVDEIDLELESHILSIYKEHLEKTQQGYKDNLITVQAVGVTADGTNVWSAGGGGVSTGVQGTYLNLPLKGSTFKTFHIPRSQYGETKTKEGSDGKTIRYCEYYPTNEKVLGDTRNFIEAYKDATKKGIFLASLGRVANVYNFMSTEQIPLADLLTTSDGTTYTLTGGAQTSSLLYSYMGSVLPFADELVIDLEGWDGDGFKQYMKDSYFETALSNLSEDDLKAYDGSVGEDKKGLLQDFLKRYGVGVKSNSSTDYLEAYNKIISEYRLSVAPTPYYTSFMAGTSDFGKYVRYIDNTSVPLERRTGGLTEFSFEIAGQEQVLQPTDYLSFLLPLYVPGDYRLADDGTYDLASIKALDDYWLSLIDLKLYKKTGNTLDLVGTITSYGGIGLGDLNLYTDGEQGVILLTKFQEALYTGEGLEYTGRGIKFSSDYMVGVNLQDGNYGKLDYLTVEDRTRGVEGQFLAFSLGADYESLHKGVFPGALGFSFVYEPNFKAGESSGVYIVRNNYFSSVSSLRDHLKDDGRERLLKKIETVLPKYSLDVDYDQHLALEDMASRLSKLKRIQAETMVGAAAIFIGYLLILYVVFLVVAYLLDMLTGQGFFTLLTFGRLSYGDDFLIKNFKDFGGVGSIPVKWFGLVWRLGVLIGLGVLLVNTSLIYGWSITLITFFRGLFS